MSNYNWMSLDQLYCYKMLCDWLGSKDRVPPIKPAGNGIRISVFGGKLSTVDFDMLTKLVMLAHDRCIRVELAGGGPRHVGIILHARHTREGGIFDRHPTMEEALQKHRQNWQTVDPIPADLQ